jgi:hypothetical protein
MNKVALRLNTLSVNDKINYARNVHLLMGTNAATFATPPVTMANFLTQIEDLETTQGATADGSKANKTLRDMALAVLESSLKLLAKYVEVVANGATDVIQLSGFSLKTDAPRKYTTIEATNILSLTNTELFGEVKLRWAKIKNAKTYQVHYCFDPLHDEGWKEIGFSLGTTKVIKGMPSGQIVWFRIKAIGAAGESEWSPAVSKRIA